MSVHYSSAVWKWRAPESSIKLVLLHLADLANHEGVCWPTQARICDETGLSKSTVNEKLNWLVGRGIIHRVSGNSARNTHYTIYMEKLAAETAGQSGRRTLQLPDSPAGGPCESGGRTKTVRQADHVSPVAGHHPSVPIINPPLPTNGGADGSSLNPVPANGSTPSLQNGTEVSPEKKEKGARPRDLCFEALVEIQGSRLKEIPRGERGQINRALHDIREVAPGLTAEELKKRAAAYREKMPGVTLTAISLAAWWSRLGSNGGAPAPDARPVVPVQQHEPEGWREVGKELYGPDTHALWATWAAVPSSNKTEISRALKKMKGVGP